MDDNDFNILSLQTILEVEYDIKIESVSSLSLPYSTFRPTTASKPLRWLRIGLEASTPVACLIVQREERATKSFSWTSQCRSWTATRRRRSSGRLRKTSFKRSPRGGRRVKVRGGYRSTSRDSLLTRRRSSRKRPWRSRWTNLVTHGFYFNLFIVTKPIEKKHLL